MARKTGQIIRRGQQMWLVRIYVGRDPRNGGASTSAKAITGANAPKTQPTSLT